MWDTLSWGGETQALIYNPHTKKVIGINALGVAPTGATPEFFQGKGMQYPPEYGPLAAVTPGTPGGLMTMLAEYGRLSLTDVLAPAIEMADGYPIEAQLVEHHRAQQGQDSKKWPYSRKAILLTAPGRGARGARARRDLPPAGSRRDAAQARRGRAAGARSRARTARRRSTPPTTASTKATSRRRSCAACSEQGGLFTAGGSGELEGARSRSRCTTNYKGIDVYKLDVWTQGPAMLQALNILENIDLKSMGYNSAALHPHALPGDEPGLRRPRLLLRRPVLPARASRSTGCSPRTTRRRARS